jgi:ComF family protein
MLLNLLNLFYPKVCAGCETILLHNEYVICTHCRHEIPLTLHHTFDNKEVKDKFYGRLDLHFVGALFYFHKKGIVQEMIHKLKYKGHEEIGTAIGLWYGSELKDHPIGKDVDVIIPVPLHKNRLKKRGYNQVTTFGQALATTLNIPFNPHVLIRSKYTETQVWKSLVERSNVTDKGFEAVDDEALHGKHFLLIDDVITTGATLEACVENTRSKTEYCLYGNDPIVPFCLLRVIASGTIDLYFS